MHLEIGTRPLSLAGHLRHLAQLLTANVVVYDWQFPNRCNCGLLARSITGMTQEQLDKALQPLVAGANHPRDRAVTWAHHATAYCPFNPDIPATGIFSQLRAAGLTQADFSHLEGLSHPELRLDWKAKHAFTDRLNVIVYLNRWADKIEAYHAAHTATEAQLDAVETRPLVTS